MIIIGTATTYGQNNVGINTTTPDASAALDVTSANTGVLVPRLALTATNVAAPVAAPATSLLVYNTATSGVAPNDVTPGYYYWDGIQWVRLLNGPAGATCVTLDEAYDCTTPGNGRIVEVNDGSIEFNQTGGANTEVLTVTTDQGTAATPNTALYSYISSIGNAILGATDNATADQVFAPVAGSVANSTTANTGVLGLYAGSNAFGSGGTHQVTTTDGGIGSIHLNDSPSNASTNYGSWSWSIGGGTNNYGVHGVAGDGSGALFVYTGNVASAGVFGINENVTGGAGVYGQGVQGVVGESDFIDAAGVFGINYGNQTTGSGGTDQVGVLGDGYNGVWGQTVYDDGIGVYGLNASAGAAAGAGVLGQANDVVVDWAVFGIGDLGATGGKFFAIDHPADPANKILKHFSVESDEPILMYRGTIELDANGEAVIEMADYVDMVNVEYSYTLTSIGAPAPNLHVKTEMASGKFSVAGGAPSKKVSWVVYGKRHDAFFQKNPEKYQVEVDKNGDQKGKYLDPQTHGQDPSKGMFHNSGKIKELKGSSGKGTQKTEVKGLSKKGEVKKEENSDKK